MEATLTLIQAGQQLGVESDALSRLIQMGALPEARQRPGVDGGGPEWVIPTDQLPNVAARNGWSIDLRNDDGRDSRGQFVTARPRKLVATAGAATGGTAIASTAPPVDLPATDEPEDPAKFGALVVRGPSQPATVESSSIEAAEPTATTPVVAGEAQQNATVPSVSEVIDIELLDRLLGAQEDRAIARAEVEHAKVALTTLNEAHNRVTEELEIERRERMVASDRFREERISRASADAKVAELRDRVAREMALAEAEKAARLAAMERAAMAERETANAFSVMGWRSRRRFRRLGH